MINEEIEHFGRSIGIENLALNEEGCLKFIFENNVNIYIEKFEDTIFFFTILFNFILVSRAQESTGIANIAIIYKKIKINYPYASKSFFLK